MEENVGVKVNVERTDELLKTGAEIVAAACPFCITMVSDGLKFREQEENVAVKDIAEIVEECMTKEN